MSYTVEIETHDDDARATGLAVTTFSGGGAGHMVQITVGTNYAQLTMDQLKELRRILKYASKHSLANWPGAR